MNINWKNKMTTEQFKNKVDMAHALCLAGWAITLVAQIGIRMFSKR